MSAEAIGWVFRHSPYKHGAFAVHAAMADAANDLHDNQVWFGVDRLAAKARVGRSTVIAALGQMEADHLLEEAAKQRGPASPTVYRMLFPEDAPVVYHDGTSPKTELVQKSNQSKKGDQLVQKPDSCPLTNPMNPSARSRVHSRAQNDLPDDFAAVWDVYPRKLARKRAQRAYEARRRAGVSAADLLAATENYAKATTGQDPQFVKHASTFFGPDEHYADYVNGIPAGANASNSGHGRNIAVVDPEVTW